MEYSFKTRHELADFLGVKISYIDSAFPRLVANKAKEGLIITRKDNFFIVNDDNFIHKDLPNEIWISHYSNEKYEVSNMGRIRNKKNKKIIQGRIVRGGYLQYGSGAEAELIHRAILQSFKPEEHFKDLTVDHINGIKNDNKLENLRWASNEDNLMYMMTHRKELNKELTRIIQKYGYDETLKKLQEIQ